MQMKKPFSRRFLVFLLIAHEKCLCVRVLSMIFDFHIATKQNVHAKQQLKFLNALGFFNSFKTSKMESIRIH